jgi:hypothetical protein
VKNAEIGRISIVLVILAGCAGIRGDADGGFDVPGRPVPTLPEAPSTPTHPSDGMPAPRDGDDDGLCDRTERQLATNPSSRDSDADDLPDLIEVGNGFDATNPNVPAEDQVAHLVGSPGSTLDFPVRLTVDGTGESLSGYFEAVGSIYADGVTVADFVQGTTATEANPADGARRVEASSARFAGVLGRTRLSFSVRFEYPKDHAPASCARAYPLRYSLKGEDGTSVAERMFLLVVAPPKSGEAPSFCAVVRCQ